MRKWSKSRKCAIYNCSLVKRSKLAQTGRKDLTKGEQHPTMDKLYFNCYLPSGKEKWVTRDEKTPRKPLIVEQNSPNKPKLPVPYKNYRGRYVIDHKAMEVKRSSADDRNNPFKREDPHPEYEAVFRAYNQHGAQQWVPVGWLDERRKRDREILSKRRKDNPEWSRAQYNKHNRAKRARMGDEAYLEHMRKHFRKSYAKNPEYYVIKASRCHKRIRELYDALPDNVKKEVDEIYELRIQLNEAAAGAGVYGRGANNTKRYSFAVDHILPLNPAPILFNGTWQRPYSGLHAPQNLQILEASENMSKSNATPEHPEPNQ